MLGVPTWISSFLYPITAPFLKTLEAFPTTDEGTLRECLRIVRLKLTESTLVTVILVAESKSEWRMANLVVSTAYVKDFSALFSTLDGITRNKLSFIPDPGDWRVVLSCPPLLGTSLRFLDPTACRPSVRLLLCNDEPPKIKHGLTRCARTSSNFFSCFL